MSKNPLVIEGKIEGLDEAIRRLQKYDTESGKKIRKVISRGGKTVAAQAKFRVPVRSGRLKKSITSRFDSNHIESVVKARSPLAHLVEYGAAATAVRARRQKNLVMRWYDRAGRARFAARGKSPTSGTVKIPKRHAQPFMEPSFRSIKPKVIREVAQVLREMPKND